MWDALEMAFGDRPLLRQDLVTDIVRLRDLIEQASHVDAAAK